MNLLTLEVGRWTDVQVVNDKRVGDLVRDLPGATRCCCADLAAAAGGRDEARLWYDRVLDLWANADPELQPEVSRIRTARASLQTR